MQMAFSATLDLGSLRCPLTRLVVKRGDPAVTARVGLHWLLLRGRLVRSDDRVDDRAAMVCRSGVAG
jgi:hypothetical protein